MAENSVDMLEHLSVGMKVGETVEMMVVLLVV